MKFTDLNLAPVLIEALAKKGYTEPTPIQQKAIKPALEGNDLVAVAQTGTGKTAAFALPTLQWMHENPLDDDSLIHSAKPIRTLILSPTRELASQIAEGFEAYGAGTKISQMVIFGGVSQNKQVQRLKRGVDVLVATPGRLIDLMNQGFVDLRDVEVFILDEADRMLDMGFIHDVKRIVQKLPEDRQTLLFSATMPQEIDALANRFMTDPVRVEVTPPSTTVEKIDQSLFHVDKENKRALLLELLQDQEIERVLVFSRTKHGANRIAEMLNKKKIESAAIHGNKSQGARERALAGFKAGNIRALIATDIAARGIDVDGVSHVIQVDLPEVPEQYVHRIGRTARAGRSGVAWAFCAPDERLMLKNIEKNIKQKLVVVEKHGFPVSIPLNVYVEPMKQGGGGRGRRGGGGRGKGNGRSNGGGRSSGGGRSGNSGRSGGRGR